MPRGGRQRGCETLRDAVGTLAWTEEGPSLIIDTASPDRLRQSA